MCLGSAHCVVVTLSTWSSVSHREEDGSAARAPAEWSFLFRTVHSLHPFLMPSSSHCQHTAFTGVASRVHMTSHVRKLKLLCAGKWRKAATSMRTFFFVQLLIYTKCLFKACLWLTFWGQLLKVNSHFWLWTEQCSTRHKKKKPSSLVWREWVETTVHISSFS